MTEQKNTRGTVQLRETELDMPVITHLTPPVIMMVGQILGQHLENNDVDFRDALKNWLISIMKQKNWSAEKWAREADISGTTITRFLNTDDPRRTPTAKTLDKLARAAGVPVMQDAQQVLIAVIRRDSLLDEAKRAAPHQVDLFSMPPDEFIPAPLRYQDCRLAELDNGLYAICHQAEPVFGKRVLVLDTDRGSLATYRYTPPQLIPAERNERRGNLPSDAASIQVLGRVKGVYEHYADEDED